MRPRIESVRNPDVGGDAVSEASDRIIIYRLGSIGDTVAALPCFHLIERAYPQSERIVLTNFPESNKAAPLDTILGAGGFIHGSIPYPLGVRSPAQLSRLSRVLRDQHAHTLIYLAESRGLLAAWRDAAFFKLCGFRRIIGIPLTRDLQRKRDEGDGILERENHRLGRTLAPLGPINLEDRGWWDLRLNADERFAAQSALGELSRSPFVAVNTGGKAVEKDWGERAWASLLTRLEQNLPGWGLTFVGGKEDRERAEVLGSLWQGTVIDLCGQLSPRESAAVLSRASLFIGHDSGAFHLADAVGAPAVGIYGSYNQPREWHPSGPTTCVIHRVSGLDDVSPDEVLAGALSLVVLSR